MSTDTESGRLDDDGPLRLDGRPPTARRRSVRRALLTVAVVVALVAGVAAGVGIYVTAQLDDQLQRVPGVFVPVEEGQRPQATEELTFLLMGSDSRSPEPTTGVDSTGPDYVPGAQRTDVIMIVTIAADRSRASVISIPRDSWVQIPGRGKAKINAAFSYGGPPLLITTVEKLTGLRIDHFMVIDFAGFQEMADAVGGIDVSVARTTSAFGVTFQQGLNHLDGVAALAYVRQRYDLPRGDLDRVRRHQNALKALMQKVSATGLLADPTRTYSFLQAVTHWISVDDTFTSTDMATLALQVRDLRSSDVAFVSAPVSGLGREGAQSVVYLDQRVSTELWRAVADDRVDAYLNVHPEDRLAAAPA